MSVTRGNTKAQADYLAGAAQAVAARRKVGDRAAAPDPDGKVITLPVAEQAHRFSEKPVAVRTEKGQVVGRAYRRHPHFVTLAKRPANIAEPNGARLITADQFRALRFYRSSWEGTLASATHCALDMSARGGSGESIGLPKSLMLPRAIWDAERLRECERALGAIKDTMRAIVLEDRTFADVAMQRWGSRERQRVILGKGKVKPRVVNEIVPRSSDHPAIIRAEFLAGLRLLAAAVGKHIAVEE